jgi:hypothetical protein
MTKKNKTGFINETTLNFSDISSETEREYTFPNGQKLVIKNPKFLNVSSSGGHRLYAEDNYGYYVKPSEGWFIKWKTKANAPDFVL